MVLKTSDLKNQRLQEQQRCKVHLEIARRALQTAHFIARIKYEFKYFLRYAVNFLLLTLALLAVLAISSWMADKKQVMSTPRYYEARVFKRADSLLLRQDILTKDSLVASLRPYSFLVAPLRRVTTCGSNRCVGTVTSDSHTQLRVDGRREEMGLRGGEAKR